MQPLRRSSPIASQALRLVFGHLLGALVFASASHAFAAGESSTPTATRTSQSSPNFYLSLGVGDTSIGPVALANLSFDVAHVLFRVRAGRTTSFALVGPPEAAITDYSALIGGVMRTGPIRIHATAGVGVGFSTRRGPQVPAHEGSSPFSMAPPAYEWVRYNKVVNLPLQLGVSLDSEYTGIGLDFVGNVNQEVSTFGVALTVSGGWIR